MAAGRAHLPGGAAVVASFQWTMIGHFFYQVFPSSVGGDVIRGVAGWSRDRDMGGAFSSIALERAVGLVALLALIAIGQPLLIARLTNRSRTGARNHPGERMRARGGLRTCQARRRSPRWALAG